MGFLTDINYTKLLERLTPVVMRKPKMLAWLGVLCHTISDYLYPLFKSWEEKSWYDIKHQTGQVQHLEYVLNDLCGYDPASPMIILGEGNLPDWLYIPLRLEDDPIFLGSIFVDRRTDYLYGIYDFSIIIHSSLEGVISEELVRAIADRYKRDGKTYKIKYETF